jgi:enamine deaminase RidA (YjgF/YER057c/UK114 family)
METDIRRVPAPAGHPPFSLAVAQGGLLHVSGCGPLRRDGTAPERFAEQFAAVLANLDAALALGGSRRSRVLKTTVLLVRAADVAEMNRLYAAAFTASGLPARTTAVVAALPVPEFLLEIEAVAALSH